MKRVVWLLFGLIILLSGCAKANDPMIKTHKLEEVQRYATLGEPLDIAIDDNMVFSAEDLGGFRVYNSTTGGLVYHMEVENEINIVQARIIRIHPLSKEIILNMGNVSGSILSFDYSNGTVSFKTKSTGGTNKLQDLFIKNVDSSVDSFLIYSSGRNAEGSGSYISEGTYDGTSLVIDEERSIVTNYETNQIAVKDNYIFAATGFLGVAVYDLNAVQSADYFNSYQQLINTPGEAVDIALNGNYLYVADKQGGFHIVKLNADKSGSIIKSFETSGYATNVVINDSYAAVSCGSGGVYLYRISNPEKVELLDNISFSEIGFVNNVYFDTEGYLYVLSRDKGIVKFRVR